MNILTNYESVQIYEYTQDGFAFLIICATNIRIFVKDL